MGVPLIPAILLIFARVTGLVGFAPGWGDVSVSVKIRLLLSVALTVVVTNGLMVDGTLVWNAGSWESGFSSITSGISILSPRFLILFLLSLMVGVFQSLILRLLLTSLEYAGSLLSQSTGLAMAEVFDAHQGSSSLLARWFFLIGVLLYFSVGGDHLLLNGLMDELGVGNASVDVMLRSETDDTISILSQRFTSETVTSLIACVGHATWLGILIAIPAAMSLIVVYLAAGLLSRLVPAWSFWNLGLPVVVLVGLWAFGTVLGRLAELVTEAISPTAW